MKACVKKNSIKLIAMGIRIGIGLKITTAGWNPSKKRSKVI